MVLVQKLSNAPTRTAGNLKEHFFDKKSIAHIKDKSIPLADLGPETVGQYLARRSVHWVDFFFGQRPFVRSIKTGDGKAPSAGGDLLAFIVVCDSHIAQQGAFLLDGLQDFFYRDILFQDKAYVPGYARVSGGGREFLLQLRMGEYFFKRNLQGKQFFILDV